jgi:uncharacterized integral membrane protein
MTQPGQSPTGPIQPGQGAAQPTSTFPTSGSAGTGQPSSFPGQPPDAGRGGRVKAGPGWFTYLFTLIAAAIAIAIAVFIAQNTDHTTIDFFGTHKSIAVAAALGIALGAGFLIGLLLGLIPALRAKRELRLYRRTQR